MAAMTAERYTPGREVASAAAADAEAAHQVAAPGAVEQLAEARTAEVPAVVVAVEAALKVEGAAAAREMVVPVAAAPMAEA